MKEYPHINTIWKREDRGPIREGDYSIPEFEYLAENQWVGTEKVDGTNIRVMWDGTEVRFGGKTDNAQMNPRLLKRLAERFPVEAMATQFPGKNLQVCLYGEGFGAGIQSGGKYLPNEQVDFVLFDVKVGEWWLQRGSAEEIATNLSVPIVPVVFTGTLAQACTKIKMGDNHSTWGDFEAEGLVLNPVTPLLRRNGERVIAKIKARDYA